LGKLKALEIFAFKKRSQLSYQGIGQGSNWQAFHAFSNLKLYIIKLYLKSINSLAYLGDFQPLAEFSLSMVFIPTFCGKRRHIYYILYKIELEILEGLFRSFFSLKPF
jgi:hypothetical protein